MARRLWPLADDPELRYSQLQAFDEAMHRAHSSAPWLHEMAPSGVGKGCGCVLRRVRARVVSARSCFFAFNFGSHETAVGFQLPVDTTGPNEPRLPILLLDSNEKRFGGDGRLHTLVWSTAVEQPHAGSIVGHVMIFSTVARVAMVVGMLLWKCVYDPSPPVFPRCACAAAAHHPPPQL